MSLVKPKLRGRTYWMRVRVPAHLVKIMRKKEITKSLKTQDYKEAQRRLVQELLHVNANFEALEAQQKATKNATYPLEDVPKRQLTSMVMRWLEKDFEHNQNIELPHEYSKDVEITLLEEDGLLTHSLRERDFNPVFDIARSLLDEAGIAYDEKSKEFVKLCELLMRAKRESVTRTLQQHTGQPILGTGDPSFVFSTHSGDIPITASNKSSMSFSDLCRLYERDKQSEVQPHVFDEIKQITRVLETFIEGDTLVHEIDNTKTREVFDLIKRLPAHVTKNFPKTGLHKAIELAEKEGSPKLGPARVNTYMMTLRSIFSYGVEEKYLAVNPASKKLRIKDKRLARDNRDPFTLDELKSIFHAPLYTGCVDDEYNVHTPGSNHPRRSRFWVPLISLWTGMRIEEICQLDAADIRYEHGVDVIVIYPSDSKRLKNEGSIRTIPIHDELKKIGFLEYVETIRKGGHAKLFPELKISSRKNYSQPFSKWFSRFLVKRNAKRDKTCFHSFRHGFRDALRDAEIPIEFVKILGGWKDTSVSGAYGKGEKASLLNKYHMRVAYPGLDLSHLYLPQYK